MKNIIYRRTSTTIELQDLIFQFSLPSISFAGTIVDSFTIVIPNWMSRPREHSESYLKASIELLRNYLPSTKQLTCSRERESFEAGICISFDRRKVPSYSCGIVTWLPSTILGTFPPPFTKIRLTLYLKYDWNVQYIGNLQLIVLPTINGERLIFEMSTLKKCNHTNRRRKGGAISVRGTTDISNVYRALLTETYSFF